MTSGFRSAEGGCQCGQVRYRISTPPTKAVFCHCRMCQKAVGGPFAALFTIPAESVEWLTREPRWFKSSNLAERAFCPECGTPMGFRFTPWDQIDLTTGSLDDPSLAPLTAHYGVESRWPALNHDDGLPQIATEDDASSPLQKTPLVSNQFESGSEASAS